MSAIWGQISFSNALCDNLEEMEIPYRNKCKLDRIEHLQSDDCYIACGLQYITKEAEHEQLPAYDKVQEQFFTADCILDNRTELLEQLKISDDTTPDGELMWQAYLKWGMQCVEHFRGVYSIAIWNQQQKKLYLVSDQTASRCLYYHIDHDNITFSTLIEPIRRIYPKIYYNVAYLRDYCVALGMMPNITSTETAFDGIYKLNPGVWLEFSEAGCKEHVYWDLEKMPSEMDRQSAGQYLEQFKQLYTESISDAMRCKGHVGIALSSGLDSASVAVIAADILKEQNETLYSYTYIPTTPTKLRYSKDVVLNEEHDVRMLIEGRENICPAFLDNEGRNCYENIDRMIDIMEMPFKAYVNIPNLYEIYEKAHGQGCSVVLTGQMGNSTVSNGYIDNVLYDLYKNKRYFTLLKNLNRYCKHVKESRKLALKGCRRYFKYASTIETAKNITYEPDNPFINRKICNEYPFYERFRSNGIMLTENIPLSREMYRETLKKKPMYTYIGEYETKLGLAAGVVLRDPTRDIRMIQFCYQLPYEIFAHNGIPRWLVRETMKNSMPDYLLDNWMRYGMQNSDWYDRMLRDWAEIKDEIIQDIKHSSNMGYTNMEPAMNALNNIETETMQDGENNLTYLMFLAVLGRFVARND